MPAGAWTYGAAFETVLPAASKDELGTGRHQLNAGALVARTVPVLILRDGWAVTGELRQTQENRANRCWRRAEARLNKQFDIHWAGSAGLKHFF